MLTGIKTAATLNIVGLFFFFVVPYLFTHNMIDIHDSLGDCNVNCLNTDVSLSVRLPILRSVNFSFPPLFEFAAYCTCSISW
jgi:hypothetical protein